MNNTTTTCDPARTLRLLADLQTRADADPWVPNISWQIAITGQATGTLYARDSRLGPQRERLQRWVNLIDPTTEITETTDGETTHLTAACRLNGTHVVLRAEVPPYRPRLCGHVSDRGLSCMLRPGHRSWSADHLHRASDGTQRVWRSNAADMWN